MKILNKTGGKDCNTSPSNILVLGVGNLLLSDEGVGVHVAQKLLNMDLPPEVEVIEGGTDGFGLINIISEADRLVLIDAVKGGGSPGSIYRFDVGDIPGSTSLFKTSLHQVGILEVINLSGLVGKTPHTTVIGVEPKDVGTGMELSPEIEALVPRIIKLVLEEASKTKNS